MVKTFTEIIANSLTSEDTAFAMLFYLARKPSMVLEYVHRNNSRIEFSNRNMIPGLEVVILRLDDLGI